MIVDHRGQPFTAKDRIRLIEEISGADRAQGRYVIQTSDARDITPARLGRLLREAETPGYGASEPYLELAERMEETDLHYLGELQTRRRQLVQIGVKIEPVSDEPQDVADADLVKTFFERDTLENELYDLLDGIAKGYAVSEIVWETSEKQWMPKQLKWRLPQWFDWDYETGSRLLLRNYTDTGPPSRDPTQPFASVSGGGWVELAPFKFVTHVVSSKSGLPIRGGLARAAAWAWMFKHYGLIDWARFAESYGQPLRLGKYPPGSSPDDLAILYRAVRMISADAAAILPQGMEIDFPAVSDVAGRSEVYKDFVEYVDRQVSILILGQTLTTQAGPSGSYSLGQVHNLVRHDIEQSDGRQLAATLRRDIVKPIVLLNRGERDAYPRVFIEREQPTDRKLLAEVLQIIVPLGVNVKVDEVLQKMGLKKPEEEDDVLSASNPTALAQTMRLALAQSDGARGDPVTAALARDLDDWRPLVDPVTEPIFAMARQTLAEGGDLSRFRDRLPSVLNRMDDQAVTSLLHRLLFSAQVSGAADD